MNQKRSFFYITHVFLRKNYIIIIESVRDLSHFDNIPEFFQMD